jgi:2-haloacid dehalogenase
MKIKAINKPKLLIFDVNETLLDLSIIKTTINTLLLNENAFNTWFSLLLQYSLVKTAINEYEDFGVIGKATLQMTAEKYRQNVNQNQIEIILGMMAQLPPHPEVAKGLAILETKGYKMVALTNGNINTVQKQTQFAQIENYFVKLFSVDAVKSFKPNPEAYIQILKEYNLLPQQAMLIAAHSWDLMGAAAQGMQTAFIAREGQVLYPTNQPDIIESDLVQVASRL